MSSPRIGLLCGGPFAFQSITILALEKYLAGIAIGSSDMQTVGLLSSECERLGMPFLEIASKNETGLLGDWIEKVNPDYIFCICFPYKIPAELLRKKPERFINFHTGPLPAYRGPMPIFEVIRRGEKNSAISVHLMEEGFDTGAVIYEETVPLDVGETFTSLAIKLSERTAITVLNMAQMLEFGTSIPRTDQDPSEANFYPYPTEKEITIDWNSMQAESIISLINASYPWSGGAITGFDDETIRITQVKPLPFPSTSPAEPGTVLRKTAEQGLEISCLGGLSILALSFGSDRGNLGMEYLESVGLETGKRFSSL
ncbi:MAG: methionyl-tRNA formyltransferase [Bacteroidetes bacterium]|nr:MAG: methionyl-tRNA formyltransferase [Bacteroidota bacterium]